jgi:hypothetical protein
MKIFAKIATLALALGLTLAHWQFFPNSSELARNPTAAQTVSVEPLPLQVFCPGALVEVGGESGVDLGNVQRIGEALVSSQTTATEVLVSPPIATVEGAGAIVADAEQSTNLISMIQSQAVDRERAKGLAASFCQKPVASGWLINGASVVGAESVLIAANPGEVEALVELEIHLPGRVINDRFALAPGEQQLIPTSGYANGESAFAIRFESSGPEISVALQNRETRGINPIGVEIEGPTLDPGSAFSFVGLRDLTQGFEQPVLRVYNPSGEVAEVVATVFGESNVELVRGLVNPASFVELPIELEGGYQLVNLTSDQPVLAAIKNSSILPMLDFAWIQPAELFSDVSIPLSRYQNSVLLANPGSTAIEITLESTTGDRLSFESLVLAPFSQVAIPSSASSMRVEGNGQFAIALEIFDRAGYAVLHPRESANLGENLSIRVN